MSSEEYKTCDICKDKTNCKYDLLFFGDWQQSREITVHYFCLLLSTNLPQRGKDCSGINGFLLRDIRKEITAASKRVCCYCGRAHASVQCHKCNEYFHIRCARQNRCLFQFHGYFQSYCDECVPKKELQPAGLKSRPSSFERCSICREQMGLYNEIIFIFGKCCNKGYAHNVCVQKYALAAGYYLRCLWCRSEEFRISVRLQGIFVPDRDARWEVQKGTYTDLHRAHSTCNMDTCFCPRGRDYNKGKWSVILCSLCGSVGAHNPKCLLGKDNAKEPVSVFKCSTCARTEAMVHNKDENEAIAFSNKDIIDKSIFMTKTKSDEKEKVANSFTPSFSEDDDTRSSDSFVTVIPLTPSGQSGGDKQVQNVESIPKEAENVTIFEMQEACAEMIIDEPSTQQPLVFNVEDEETQVFVPNPEHHKTKLAEETILVQQSLALNIHDDDETQKLVVSSPNISKGNDIAEAALMQQPNALEVQHDVETQVLSISSPDIDLTDLPTKPPMKEQHLAEASSTTATPSSETIQELSYNETILQIDVSNQSPVVTSSSQIEDQEDWISFDLYEYDDVKGTCVGSATVRINMNEERFAGMTLEQIEENSCELIRDEDIISRNGDIGIFAKINTIIAEYI